MPRLIILTRPLLIALCLLVYACGTLNEKADEYAGWEAEKFYQEGKKALDAKNYAKAIKLYEALEARYPFGSYATQAQLDIAYAYYKNDEPESAIAAADRFIKLNPTSPHVDYAYYLKGLVNYNRGFGFLERFLPTDWSQRDPGPAQEAYDDFSELVNRFPDSRYVPDARQRMIALRNNISMHEIHVARYYLKRRAYVAAANRASQVIQNYQRTTAVPLALQIMEEAYRKLGLNELAEDAARVYALNYEQGVPIPEGAPVKEPTWMEKLWDFIGLEE